MNLTGIDSRSWLLAEEMDNRRKLDGLNVGEPVAGWLTDDQQEYKNSCSIP